MFRVELQPRHVVQIAEVMYNSVHALRRTFGDIAHPSWKHADESRRHDAELIVRRIAVNKIVHPSQIHEQWRDEMYRDGWRGGAIADEAELLHPEICDWSELPPEAQTRYCVAFAVAATLLANIGLIVVAEQERQRKLQ